MPQNLPPSESKPFLVIVYETYSLIPRICVTTCQKSLSFLGSPHISCFSINRRSWCSLVLTGLKRFKNALAFLNIQLVQLVVTNKRTNKFYKLILNLLFFFFFSISSLIVRRLPEFANLQIGSFLGVGFLKYMGVYKTNSVSRWVF